VVHCASISGIFIMALKRTVTFVVAGVLAVSLAASLAVPAFAAKRKSAQKRTVVAAAAVSGLAASHSMRREGNRLCFADHYHYGSSSGQQSMKAAQAAAVASWADFVDFEYDSSWTSFARASSKEVKCSQGTSGWGCDASARPCR
jgi:hypothetical protein